ncbi:MAG: hypothetical protein ED556_11605 [Winogradskyella sp.]|uniref:zinc-dependent peptidase n=1 Tax=Winogradskyella sp. TaxID=1883156 RepID=UPI000F3DAA04|nr:zinc-dependent peptidase [Winogradskyella sp.]RNC84101.1 MAG: hypothetical protein ED556_11605 [Winogradskyella sp.]
MANSGLIFNILFLTLIGFIVLRYIYRFAEQTYAETKNRPFYINFILIRRRLTKSQLYILRNQFSFYNKLSSKDRRIFEHRVATFINEKQFHTRQDLELTDEIKVLVAATAVKLTFGFRSYLLPIIRTILVYPEAFYSRMNEQLHKGEVNPQLGIIALSWKDFVEGYDDANDNLNLGIHEFGHAIHLNSYKFSDVSAMIFRDCFMALKRYLRANEDIRRDLISTRYFREYAYTNEFEFVAVLIECFIETPMEFKTKFPEIYNYVRRMLNFNFANY